MGLYVSTTGTDVFISELGYKISHPTTDFHVDGQFSDEEIRDALSLTTAITSGVLVWKKTAGGAVQLPADYDPDHSEAENLNTGTGKKGDRLVSFADLRSKSGYVAPGTFSGNPKVAAVTFGSPMPNNNYMVKISGEDGRLWLFENRTVNGFTINSDANKVLTSNVYWEVTNTGEDT